MADSDNTAELLRQTGLEESSLLYARWSGEVRRPACFVAVCAAERWVVLGIRGTLNLNDCFTDVDAAEVAWHSLPPKPLVLSHPALVFSTFDAAASSASSGSAWPLEPPWPPCADAAAGRLCAGAVPGQRGAPRLCPLGGECRRGHPACPAVCCCQPGAGGLCAGRDRALTRRLHGADCRPAAARHRCASELPARSCSCDARPNS